MARHSANNAVLHVFVFAPYCARLGRALSCICVQVTVQTMFCALVHPDIGSCPLTLDPDRLSAEWNSKKMSLSTCAGFCHSFLRYGLLTTYKFLRASLSIQHSFPQMQSLKEQWRWTTFSARKWILLWRLGKPFGFRQCLKNCHRRHLSIQDLRGNSPPAR